MLLLTRAAANDAAGKEKRTLLARQVCEGNQLVVPETFAQVLFAPGTPGRAPELVDEVWQWMAATPAEGLIGGLLAMRDREDYVDRLQNIQILSLVVGAEQDLAVPLEHSQVLADGLTNAELKIIPEAGHMANLEKPEMFNRVLRVSCWIMTQAGFSLPLISTCTPIRFNPFLNAS